MLERSCFLVGGVSNKAGISYLSCTLAFSLSLFHCRFLNTYFLRPFLGAGSDFFCGSDFFFLSFMSPSSRDA